MYVGNVPDCGYDPNVRINPDRHFQTPGLGSLGTLTHLVSPTLAGR